MARPRCKSESLSRFAVGSLMTFGLSACSLMGLGDFDLRVCEDSTECKALNEAEGLGDDACFIYQCRLDREPGCEKRPRDIDEDDASPSQCAGEIDAPVDCDDETNLRTPTREDLPDGLDNDCDMIIDEDGLPENPPRSVASLDALPFYLSADSNREGTVLNLVLGTGSVARIGTTKGDLLELAYRDRAADKEGCPKVTGTGNCDFHETSIASIGENRLIASVSSIGCAQGALRVGVNMNGQSSVWLGSPGLSSAIEYGVDTGRDECSGQSLAAVGAARPSIAASAPENVKFGQGLVAWISDAYTRSYCGPQNAAEVAVLGLWIRDSSDRPWVDASNDGIPDVLGLTLGGGAPAVLPFGKDINSGGYFVSYGDDQGSLSLHFIPFLDDPPADPQKPPGELPLAIASQFQLKTSGVDHVALALGNQMNEGEGTSLGVAWRSGCGGDGNLMFSKIDFTGSYDGKFSNTDVSPLAQGIEIVDGPVMAYVSGGFVVEGYHREEGDPQVSLTGGFLVVWVQNVLGQNRLKAIRVLEEDGRPLDDEPFTLGADNTGRFPVLYGGKNAPVSYVFVAEENSEMMVGEAIYTSN